MGVTRRGLWLGASALLSREVWSDEPYPHVHNARLFSGHRLGGKGCAACMEAVAPPLTGDEEHTALHACRPAGRGTRGTEWTCGECGQRWALEEAVKAGITTRTWSRR